MSPSESTTATPRSIIYLGIDVHKESITIAVLPAGAKTTTRIRRLPNDAAKAQSIFSIDSRGMASYGRAVPDRLLAMHR